METEIIGLRGNVPFEEIIEHFTLLGGEVVLMNPEFVYGKDMVESAVEHAQRAFTNNTNRSKSIMTEIMVYTACERQISKAMAKMKPTGNEYVAVVIDVPDMKLDTLGMERDDSIIDGTPEKAEAMGLINDMGIPCEDIALENIAILDLEKK